MPSALRRVLAVVLGAASGMIVVFLCDGAVAGRYPVPEDLDLSDPDRLRAAILEMPAEAMPLILLGWVLAAAVGGFVAARVGRSRGPGWVVTLFLLAATVANLAAIPHPLWMWPAALALIPLAGWSATALGSPA